jgi:hypothetical protein
MLQNQEGFNLIGLRHISSEELTPNGFQMHGEPLNEHEINRLNDDFIKRRFRGVEITPFAFWAIYEEIAEPNIRFSLLHIGGEACATFDAFYVNNKINPIGVAIFSPSEGYGDNWTLFTNPTFRFYQLIKYNQNVNGAIMSKYLLTDAVYGMESFWNGYIFYQAFQDNDDQREYRLFQLI